MCVLKHLGQASVLLDEAKLGYPEHRWLAVGHLAEAESESLSDYPVLAQSIRETRKIVMDGGDMSLISLIHGAEGLLTQIPIDDLKPPQAHLDEWERARR